ncbi:MAG: phosphatase PAP2 family protein [Alphaproteobacteria bacterium]|nr:phosphatase PAP2 family protein [Alphaproteobacteria bacterium]
MSYDTLSYAERPPILARAGQYLARLTAEGLRAHALYLAIIPTYALASLAVAELVDGSQVVDLRFYSEVYRIILTFCVIGIVGGITLWVAVIRPPKGSLFAALWRTYRTHLLAPRRIVYFALAALPVPLFLTAYGSFKRLIPFINPYSWDPTFMAWDKFLHGGRHPFELLQPILGNPYVTASINFAYHLWFFVLFLTLIWQFWSGRDPKLRMQFMLSFQLCWILVGSVLATAFASGGPCYYGRLTGLEDPFAPLMSYLYAANEQVPLMALNLQEMLWEVYVSQGDKIGSGISAMPSMHVASTVLMALLGWRIHRWLGIAYTAFALLILVGSVHLGWHYAIDGYIAALVTIAIWWGVGAAIRRWPAIA